jgi:putative Holliday junction resolvase
MLFKDFNMIISDFKDFPLFGKILGIDWGAKRIGVAITDETHNFFWTRPRIENKPWSRAGVMAVSKLIATEEVVGVVIGLPLRMDGTESETTIAVRQFAKDLTSYMNLPIIFIDETLTSASASEFTKSKDDLDSESAKIILENAVGMMTRNRD